MTLRNELTTDPLGLGYAAMTNAQVEASLNAKTRTRLVETRIGYGAIMSALGATAGATVLDNLETVAASNSPVKWAMKLLAVDNLNISNVQVRAQVDVLAAGGVMTVAQATTLKALASQSCSRAEEIGIAVNDYEIREARA